MDTLQTHFRPGVLLNRRYETISPLNHGSFGMVMMARDRTTRSPVAIKCFRNPSAQQDQSSGFKVDERSEELKIHSRIGHNFNIVNLLDHFSTSAHTFLVLEYCSMGDLYEAIRQDKGPKETEHVREFMLQLVNAVEYLHRKGIFHRDIKPENIFLTENGDMKLGDFGLATMDTWSFESAVGSDRYMAPEQYDYTGNGLSPAKADIWSIGICLLNILFSRNPFGVPAMTDPLFADYVRDRQSLFDVFPNMSQDTFEILNHCLSIDPSKRDLSLVKDALERVVSFTTDDESLDEFCTENRDVVFATANRQPLRTPSIHSPNLGINEAFPWTRALHMTSPPSKLSAVHDVETHSEDLFPGSEASSRDWLDKTDAQSFDSVGDSGLGVSISSSQFQADNNSTRSRPVPIAGSLPLLSGRATSAIASIFGKKKPFESKSWSDLYDEDLEEEQEDLARRNKEQLPVQLPSRPSKVSMLSQEDDSDDGRSTPRAIPINYKAFPAQGQQNVLPHTESPEMKSDDNVSQHTGFVFEDDKAATPTPTAKYSPPTKRSNLVDKWAALGEMRRRVANNPEPASSVPNPIVSAPEQPKRRFRPNNWRRNLGFSRQGPDQLQTQQQQQQPREHKVWQQKEWNMSRDWRRSDHNLPRSPLSMHPSQLDGSLHDFFEEASDDEHLVGPWRELHL